MRLQQTLETFSNSTKLSHKRKRYQARGIHSLKERFAVEEDDATQWMRIGPFSVDTASLFARYIVTRVASDTIRTQMREHTVVPYEPASAGSTGFAYVVAFIEVIKVCRSWLQTRLASIGWSMNCTGVDPFSTTRSIPEVLQATLVCFQRSCSYMIAYNNAFPLSVFPPAAV